MLERGTPDCGLIEKPPERKAFLCEVLFISELSKFSFFVAFYIIGVAYLEALQCWPKLSLFLPISGFKVCPLGFRAIDSHTCGVKELPKWLVIVYCEFDLCIKERSWSMLLSAVAYL